ncbi:helix-turn-helix domain-containing protein [Nitriliruptoraceae bacterium ZYF776]|nr:helix-turn-helix domain-containing protein [Profundirhabdus halotolerans]
MGVGSSATVPRRPAAPAVVSRVAVVRSWPRTASPPRCGCPVPTGRRVPPGARREDLRRRVPPVATARRNLARTTLRGPASSYRPVDERSRGRPCGRHGVRRGTGRTLTRRHDVREVAVARDEIVWLSTKEAARRLGIAPSTLYKLIDAGELPAYRFGRVIRLQQAEVDGFIDQARIKPGTLDSVTDGADEL